MVRFPPIQPVHFFLKRIFAEEQAALGAEFPMGAHTARDLAASLNRQESAMMDLLETMADQLLRPFFVSTNDETEKQYSWFLSCRVS